MKGYSLHIGLDKVGSNYSSLEDLNGAVLDAKNMHFLARKNGFQMIPFKSPDLAPLDSVLLNEMATRENILDGIYQAAKTLEPKDFFFLTFSGHGGRKTDASGDERIDQTWCLFDYQFLDDELHNLMAQFERGVRILVLSDSCYSGSILEFLDFFKGRSRNAPDPITMKNYLEHKKFYDKIRAATPRKKAIEIKASVKLISACEEHKKAYEDSKGGEFTKTLLRVWDEGRFRGNYDEFHKRINKKIKKSQRPQLVPLGPVLSDFDNCKPFKI